VPFAQALDNSYVQAASIIIVVVALQSVWSLRAKYHPLTLYRLLAMRLDLKVNHPNRGKLQNYIAGSLGFISLTLPILVILYFALELVYFRWFFDGLILFIALSSSDKTTLYNRTYKHLSKQNKIVARACVSSMVLRSTDRLSPLGCAKAAMESSSLRFYYHFATILFWFFLIGPLFALWIRLISECHQAWNCRLSRYQYFGVPVARLNSLLQTLPCGLHCLLFSLLYRPSKTAKQWFLNIHRGSRQLIVACTAYALPCELGGPSIYNDHKVRFERHNENIHVKLGHMLVLKKYLRFKATVLVIVYAFIALTLYSLDLR
jgi:adenosylcobinamide-phosphate synthase